jgi:copper(I)-binding protein
MSARIAVFVGLLFLVGSASAHEYSRKGVTVVHPWARATPGGAKVGGAYFEMKADRGHSDRLIGARCAGAGVAELHRDTLENGIAKMRRVNVIALPGGSSVVLKPGGYHVMPMDLVGPLKEGDLLKLTLVFDRAGEIEVEATIEPLGATGPHGFTHQPVSEPPPTHKH